jgi:TRAP-type C4-dicarboxylate transport system permease small subunit
VKKLDAILRPVENVFLTLLLLTELGIVFAQVVARFFHGGWIFIDEFSRYMVLWLGIFGAILATRDFRHIAIDFLIRFVPPTFRTLLYRLQSIVGMGVSLLLLYAGSEYVKALADEISPTMKVPIRYLLYPVLVGFFLLFLRFFITLFLEPPKEPIREGEKG